MIITRKKHTIYLNLFVGIALYILIGYTTFFEEGGFKLNYLIFLAIGTYYILSGIYNYFTPLIYLHNKEIIFYSFPNKKTSVSTNEVSVKYSAGDYIFTTKNKKSYSIDKSQVSSTQISFVESYVNTLSEKSLENSNLVS